MKISRLRLSQLILVAVCILVWVSLKTVYDIMMVQKPSSGSLQLGDIKTRTFPTESLNSIEESSSGTKTNYSKSRIRRKSYKDSENITLQMDTASKTMMSHYMLITEAEEELKDLKAELNRIFPSNNTKVTKPVDPIALEELLDHMKKEHPPPSEHYYGYDVTESNGKPVNRKLPDFREEYCKHQTFNLSVLPSVSIITPFHNEAVTMLLRHLHAIINTSPRELLTEIILVDDVSTLDNLGPDLERYVKQLDNRIRLIRNTERQGVARSRMVGADAAKGDVLIFLDSHMECTPGWLEPILSRLVSQPNALLQPQLPTSVETSYPQSDMRGAFTWNLSYIWSPYPAYLKSHLHPGVNVPSPALTGCAIAATRAYFYYLGGFDKGMEIWGGEHFELAFRAWMCGGRVETVTCSVVGHMYKLITYDFRGDPDVVRTKNNLRVAEIWMDEFKDIVYAELRAKPNKIPVFSKTEWKSIETRKEMRKKLQCGSFKSYVEMFPELKVPSKDYVYFGAVMNFNSSQCLVVQPDGYVAVGEDECGDWRLKPEEQFIIDKWGRLMFEDVCIGMDETSMQLKASSANCIEMKTQNITWGLNPGPKEGVLQLSTQSGKYCAIHNQSNGTTITMTKCDSTFAQRWSFAYKFDFAKNKK